jgi:hypothetical protein
MRSFANRYARTLYSRDWLALFFARQEGTNVRMQMRMLKNLSRDELILMLRDIIRHEHHFGRRPSNSVRAAYMRERHARLIDRALLRQWCLEVTEDGECHPGKAAA